jgi:hypothetical protein
LIRPDRLPYRLFSITKFVRKYFQIAHKPEQTQWSGTGIPTVQLGYVHLIVWHNSFFPWLTYSANRHSGALCLSCQLTPQSVSAFPRVRDARMVKLEELVALPSPQRQACFECEGFEREGKGCEELSFP